jgi:cobalt/nickel transport system ATP-binding protein
VIQARNLTVKYIPGDTACALQDISFSVHAGERVAILGANGAGKSTLLLTLVGALAPVSGSLSIDGLSIEKKTLREVRAKAGMVFQNPDDQLFMPTVYEDLAFGPRNYALEENLIKIRADKTLRELGISHLASRMTNKLSGGEKRLAALAGVLVMEPEALLLDEPTSFLDPRSRRRLTTILLGLRQTLMIATHDIELARGVCGRAILLKEGKIAADGGSAEILANTELLEECGL